MAKYHKLKYGTDLVQGDMNPPVEESGEEVRMDTEAILSTNTNASWKQSRQLLRQYLQEIGYTDTIIDLRSNRVRSLLGINQDDNEENHNSSPAVNGSDTAKRPSDSNKWSMQKKPATTIEAHIRDAERSVIENLDFLHPDVMELVEDDDEEEEDEEDEVHKMKSGKVTKNIVDDDVDGETVDAIDHEFRFLQPEMEDNSGVLSFGPGSRRPFVGGPGGEEDALEGLGELAQLTVTIDADSGYDPIASTKENFRKTWTAKYTLRSHFDGVRALCFHPQEPVLITASEDATLKLWNLQKTVPAKKSASLDVEPVYTFRGHIGPVLSLTMNTEGKKCFSGGIDNTIRVWNVPSSDIDPYNYYDPRVLEGTLQGHTDSVWGLVYHPQTHNLLSCGADSTVRLWSPDAVSPLLSTFALEKDGTPTSVDFVYETRNQFVCSFDTANCVIFDLETGKPVIRLDTEPDQSGNSVNRQINRVVSHPTLPLTITGHEDRHIRFWDNNTGRLVQSMVAHLDSVTSLAVDPNGLYLLSGSHDCSIRLWQLDSKQCVQEITAHRKKFDESIFDVAFHPTKPFIASAGADALSKVFV
ncbi:connector of kinase to AP-1 isoform X1 [Oratosquilla oratoria]|uniref:connector of kinase to AP-1 isoform X1 n=1 Tax=Oratosquilla oratoria TaxID=337810 RepID=UPI003F76DB77